MQYRLQRRVDAGHIPTHHQRTAETVHKNDLYIRLNKEMVSSHELTDKYDIQELKEMIREHVACTNSAKGRKILDNFEEYIPRFKKIIPHDYERMMAAIVAMEEKGLSPEAAQIEAFYANTGR